MQKSEKSLEPFLRKLRYQPTNQPTNYYQQHRFYRTCNISLETKKTKKRA